VTTVHLEISRESIVVRLPADSFSMTIPNTISLRGKLIVAIGDIEPVAAVPSIELVTSPGFDSGSFDPVLAGAMTRWLLMESLKRAHISWRRQFALPAIEIGWAAWASIPLDRRRTFLTAHRSFRVDVNGRPAVRPRVDVLLLRGAFGTRIDPGP
jgi:hypothetical protein